LVDLMSKGRLGGEVSPSGGHVALRRWTDLQDFQRFMNT